MSTYGTTRFGTQFRSSVDEAASRSSVTLSVTDSIDAAILGLETSELDIVLRFVRFWERAHWMTRQEAMEWRRRISAQQVFVRLFPDRTFVLRFGGPRSSLSPRSRCACRVRQLMFVWIAHPRRERIRQE